MSIRIKRLKSLLLWFGGRASSPAVAAGDSRPPYGRYGRDGRYGQGDRKGRPYSLWEDPRGYSAPTLVPRGKVARPNY